MAHIPSRQSAPKALRSPDRTAPVDESATENSDEKEQT